MKIILDGHDLGRLTPGVAVHKDVVGCDTKHDEDNQLVERRIHGDLEDASVDEVADREGKDDEQHREACHKETLQVEPNVEYHEQHAEYCIGHVTL